MLEQMEARIEAHIKSILNKESIDFYDYQTLVGEIARQTARAKEAKWDAGKEERNSAMINALKNMMNN